ncbi:GIN domain-containing protein [Dokdonia sp. Hel_I_53]|uniref:GIN domain-containing protein n=1 Tax=Dokdonia sp. Hel_I_53 TaxID=1566287 RepID=UPI0011998FE6|nr:DUF2807 domain-containing protein [Dokdonia sp. Hel_I_53]TVZ50892.1 putative autotransporter adhesin-like protein [Dokdonia sp. Hel_I_53]
MKKITIRTIILTLLILATLSVSAQREKIKGSRNVKELSEPLRPFTDIKVIDGLEVTLIQDATTGYDLEMDDNLLEIISFDIRDSTLLVSTRKDIRSSKKLNIIVRFEELNSVTVAAYSKVISKSTINTEDFACNLTSDSVFEGEIKSENAVITADESSKVDVEFKGDEIRFNLKNNAFAKADINTEKFVVMASGRTDMNFKGNAEEATITLTDNAEFKGRAFAVDQASLVLKDDTNALISIDKDLVLDMNHKSELELYGSPSIVIEKLAGNSKILKKE